MNAYARQYNPFLCACTKKIINEKKPGAKKHRAFILRKICRKKSFCTVTVALLILSIPLKRIERMFILDNKNNVEIAYSLADGTKKTLMVSAEIANVVGELRLYEKRIEKSIERHETFTSYSEVEEIIPTIWLTNDLDTTDNLAEQSLLRRRLLDAVDKLEAVHRRRIYMQFFLDMKYADIAKAEGVTIRAVEKTINAALKKLKKLLS